MDKLKSSLHISVQSKLLSTFNEYSKETGKSRNQIIEQLIIGWVEDQADIKLAEKTMRTLKESENGVISHEEMMKRLGW